MDWHWHGGPLHMAGDVLFESGLRNVWPLFVLPFAASLLSDRTARLLPRTPEASGAAAVLAAAPAMVTLGVLYPALTTYGRVITWEGVTLFYVTPAVAITLITYAAFRAVLRQRDVARLFRASTAPGERLAAAAARFGLRARELPTLDKECFVAGVLRPTVFLSKGALDGLADDELDAALSHEQAHIEGRDTVWLIALAFLRDLAPWGRAAALEAFQTSREALADRKAASSAGSLSLASALVALARPGPTPAGVLPMAKNDTLRWRMQALLEEAPEATKPRSWAQVVGGVGLNVALVAWPAAQWGLMELFCN
jgi:Zn-dependent protease with chaperone function